MYNKNVAFNVIPLEHDKRGQVLNLPKNFNKKVEKNRSIKSIIYSGFSTFLIAAIGISVYIFGQAQLTEYTDKVCKASKQLEESQSENISLSMKYKSANSFSRDLDYGNNTNVEIVRVPSEDAALVK